MSKERLEELKKDHRFNKNIGQLTVLSVEWIDWLIEQAERVQELKEEVEKWKKATDSEMNIAGKAQSRADRLEHQNKRYREAMEKALTEGEFEDVHTQLERIITELSNALEGDLHD